MTSDISNHAYVMKLKEQCSQAPFSFPYTYFTLCISSLWLFLNYIHPWWLTDWFKIEKGICQGCILLSCLFNLYAEYNMWNGRLDEAQAGIKIARGNINNLGYADDTTLMAESEEELKSLLVKVREWKIWLKTQTIKKWRSWQSGPITLWQIDGETIETGTDYISLGSKITADNDSSHEIKRCLLLGRKVMINPNSVLRSRDTTLPTKVHSSGHVWMWELDPKEDWAQKN